MPCDRTVSLFRIDASTAYDTTDHNQRACLTQSLNLVSIIVARFKALYNRVGGCKTLDMPYILQIFINDLLYIQQLMIRV